MLSALPGWPWNRKKTAETDTDESVRSLLQAHEHLNQMLEDTSIPSAVRAELSGEFEELQQLSERISREEIHIAAFGRVASESRRYLTPCLVAMRSQRAPAWRNSNRAAVRLGAL